MTARIRYRSWSSSEEHFRYDPDTRLYVPDTESDHSGEEPRDTGARGIQELYAHILETLAEIRREFELEPANDWEAGHLLTLYGAARAAAAPLEAAPKPRRKLKARDRSWSFLGQHSPERSLWRKRRSIEIFLNDMTHICEIVVARHWPDALPRLEEATGSDGLRKTERLNNAVKQLGLLDVPTLRTIVDVWLGSFDKPANYSDGDRLLHDDLDRTMLWMDAWLAGGQRVLSNAGPTMKLATLGTEDRVTAAR